ncbi:hypothetical protein MPER_06232 [Moniliophthora perniciosa FA553]|nr:hypothetical protein MPER_06232 [Moniliophthora perniciosa FA553]
MSLSTPCANYLDAFLKNYPKGLNSLMMFFSLNLLSRKSDGIKSCPRALLASAATARMSRRGTPKLSTRYLTSLASTPFSRTTTFMIAQPLPRTCHPASTPAIHRPPELRLALARKTLLVSANHKSTKKPYELAWKAARRIGKRCWGVRPKNVVPLGVPITNTGSGSASANASTAPGLPSTPPTQTSGGNGSGTGTGEGAAPSTTSNGAAPFFNKGQWWTAVAAGTLGFKPDSELTASCVLLQILYD